MPDAERQPTEYKTEGNKRICFYLEGQARIREAVANCLLEDVDFHVTRAGDELWEISCKNERQHALTRLRALSRGAQAEPAFQVEHGEAPAVNIRCELDAGHGIGASTSLRVVRVEREDDGSLTAVTDHWPRRDAQTSSAPSKLRPEISSDEAPELLANSPAPALTAH